MGLKIDYLSPTLFLSDIFIVLFIFASFVNWLFSKKHIEISKPPFLFLLLFLISLIASIFANGFRSLFFLTFLKILEFSLYALSCFLLDFKRVFYPTILTLSFGIFWSSFLAIVQFYQQQSLGLWFLGERSFNISTPGISQLLYSGQLFLRPYASFPHPNLLGAYLALFLPWTLFFLLKRGKKAKIFVFLLFTFLFGFLALFLTFSRTSWIVGFGSIFFILVNFGWQKKRLLPSNLRLQAFFVLVALLVLLSSFLFVGPIILERFLTISTSDANSLVLREKLAKAAISMFLSAPIFGLGPGNFIPNLPNFWRLQETIRILQPAHNIILLVLAETGIIGALSFIFLFGGTIFGLLNFRQKEKETVLLFVLCLVSIIFLSMFDHYFWTLQQGLFIFWLVLGLSWSFCYKRRGA